MKKNTVTKLFAICLFLMMLVVPAATAYDASPIVTYFTHTYIDALSEATFYGSATDYADNAGMRRIVLYEDGSPIFTEWCNTASDSCDMTHSVSYESAQTHNYKIRAQDKSNQWSSYSTVRTVDYGGVNHAPVITTQSPSSNPTIDEQELITFSARATDEDYGDRLRFKWKVDGTTVFEETDMSSGHTSYYDFSEDDAPPAYDEAHSVCIYIYDQEGSADAYCWTAYVQDTEPDADISGPSDAVEGQTVTFNAAGSTAVDGIDEYIWTFGDGASVTTTTPSASHAYTTVDSGVTETFTARVRVVDNDGSTNDATMDIDVADIDPIVDSMTGDLNVDEGSPASFSVSAHSIYPAADAISNYEWFFGDGSTQEGPSLTSVTHTYADDDASQTVRVRVHDEDSYTEESLTIVINDVDPVVSIQDPFNGVEGENVTLSVTAAPGSSDDLIVDYDWDFGDGETETTTVPTTTHVYDQNDTYTLTVTVNDEDSSTVVTEDVIIADTLPTVLFDWTPLNPMEGQNVDFTDLTTAYDMPLSAWEWDIDGTLYTTQNTSHTFFYDGSYDVTLTVWDADMSPDSFIATVVVGTDDPIVNMSVTPLTGEEPLDVDATCTATNGNAPYDYEIDFGNGDIQSITDSMSNSFTANTTYLQNDTYTITCTVTDDDGDSNQFTQDVVVTDSVPVADFYWVPATPGVFELIDLFSNSTAYDGIASWEWDLDNDGMFDDDSNENSSVQFNFPGTYSISLQVTDNDGSISTVTHGIDVGAVPDANVPEVTNVEVRPDPRTFYDDGSLFTGDINNLILATVLDVEDLILPSVIADIEHPMGGTVQVVMSPLQGDACKFYVEEVDQVFTDWETTPSVFPQFTYNSSDYEIQMDQVNAGQCRIIVREGSDDEDFYMSVGDTNTALGLTISMVGITESDQTGYCRVSTEFNGTETNRWLISGDSYMVDTTSIEVDFVDETDGCGLIIDSLSVAIMDIGDDITVNDVTVEVLDYVAADEGLYTAIPALAAPGMYNLTIVAADSSSNVNDTEGTTFELINTFVPVVIFGNSTTTITAPADGSSFNLSDVFDVDVDVGAVGGDIENCSAEISFSEPLFQIMSGNDTIFVGDVADGTSQSISFGLNATMNGTAYITVSTTCDGGQSSLDSIMVGVEEVPIVTPFGDSTTTIIAPADNVVYNISDVDALDIEVGAVGGDIENCSLSASDSMGILDITGLPAGQFNVLEGAIYAASGSIEALTNGTTILTVNTTCEGGLDSSDAITVVVGDGSIFNNTAPVIVAPIVLNYTVNENETLVIDVDATDADNDTLTYSTDAPFGTFNTTTGVFNWTPTFFDAGNYTVIFNVTDGNGGSDSITVNIEVIDYVDPLNTAPVLVPIGNQTVLENTTLVIDVDATDADNDTLFYSTDATFGTMNSSTGVFTWDTNFTDAGNYSVTFTVDDGMGGTDSETINIEVIDVPIGGNNTAPVLAPIGNQTVLENNTLTIDVDATDADNDTLTYSTDAVFGTMNATSGVFTWDTTFLDAGNYTVTFTVDDSNGGTDAETINIEVIDVPLLNNTAPVLDPVGDQTVLENATLTVSLTASDADNDTLSFSTDAAFGTMNATSGVFTWTTGFSDAGNYTVTFTVTDGTDSDNETINIEVIDVPVIGNVPPVMDPIGNQTVLENATLYIDVNATDADNDTLTYSTDATFGLFNPATGEFSWTPGFADEGNYTVTFTVDDGMGNNDSETINIEVIDVPVVGNNAPVLAPIGNQTVLENATLVIDVDATDADNDTLTYSTDAVFGNMNSTSGVFTWTPGFLDAGNYTVTFSVTDGTDSDSETINIEVIDVPIVGNNAPVLSPIGNQTVLENNTLVIDVDATDADNDTLTYSTDAVFGTMNATSGVFTWDTTFLDAGNYTVTFNVTDGTDSDSETINIEVIDVPVIGNTAPVLDPVGDQTVLENATLTVSLTATDADNDTLSYSTDAVFGTMNATSGVFTWDTTFLDAGNYTVTFFVTDGTDWDNETINIEVIDVPIANNPPVLAPIGNQTVLENATLVIDVDATDADNDTLTYSTDAVFGTMNSTTGVFTWTTDFTDSGNYTVTFSVTDGIDIDSEIINIEVINVPIVINNSAPDLQPIANRTFIENSTWTIQLNATDADFDPLTYGTNATFGSLNPSTGLFTWTPAIGDAGLYAVEFNVSDGNGGYDVETTWIEVLPFSGTNNPPIMDPLSNVFVIEGDVIYIDVNATDIDLDTLTYATDATFPGQVFNSVTGEFGWATQMGDAGVYVVTFNVTDGNGGFDQDVIVITVTANTNPVLQAIPDQVISENQTIVLDVNATDAEGDALVYATDAPYGLFNVTSGVFTWTPSFVDAGNHTITFNVTDARGGFDQMTVNIEVLDVPLINNSPPVFDPVADMTINETDLVSIDLNATDADLDPLVYSTDAAFGTFDNATGLFTWTTDYTSAGNYTIVFGVSDGVNPEQYMSVDIEVLNVNRAPVLSTVGNYTVVEGDELIILLVATDADNDTLTYGTNATMGSFDTATGTFNWTPAMNASGVYNVEFTVSDGMDVDSESITITVIDFGTVPNASIVATPTSGIVPLSVDFEGSTSSGDAPFTYTWDLDGDGIFETSGQNVSFTYTLAGVYNVALNVTDSDGDSDVATVAIDAQAQSHAISVDTMTHNKVGSTVWLDDVLTIDADLSNNGNVAETVTVELVVNGIVEDTQVVVIAASGSDSVTFNWQATTSGFKTAIVRAVPVSGETDLTDNSQQMTFEVVLAEDVVSSATREIFFDTNAVGVGGNVEVYLPIQNADAVNSYYDLIAELYGASSFTIAPSTIQLIDLAGGDFQIVQWTLTSTATAAGSYDVGAYLGNNEITIPSKTIIVS